MITDRRFHPGSKNRLTRHDLPRFPGDALFDRIGRVVCGVERLPRKELYEAWEVARRVRRLHRGGRIVDAGGGHGLLAHVMLLLDASSSAAIVVDPHIPPSAAMLHDAMAVAWPRLADAVTVDARDLSTFALSATDVVVSSHACGALTDRILAAATAARAPVAVLPCCHDVETCDAGALRGWVDAPLAIDLMRAVTLERLGYRVRTQRIPEIITPKNRLLIGLPNPA